MSTDNWLESVSAFSDAEAIDLRTLQVNDEILVVTKNTRYHLKVLDPVERKVEMKSTSESAPSGLMTLMGCALGMSSSLAPDRLFCEGNLELTFRNEESQLYTHTTSSITRIAALQIEGNSIG